MGSIVMGINAEVLEQTHLRRLELVVASQSEDLVEARRGPD